LIPSKQWEVYKFRDKPGLILIKNPFTPLGQRYWMQKLLKDYTKHPHPNNLLPARFNQKVIEDFWEALNDETDDQQRRLIKKSMRWTTLGYHYDWTNKIYDENFRNDFPADLHRLVATIADALNFRDYKSEAAIINFYPIGSTLSAHTDHSEFFLDSPLFSISFGQAAIFLIGGHEREDEATPILLNSGDILVMSTESRLCYHAVPRVFKCDRHVWNEGGSLNNCEDLDQPELLECLKEESWKPFEAYLSDSRINVNVRQVNK
jgi:alkylated DNA repair protein alkB homolog 1